MTPSIFFEVAEMISSGASEIKEIVPVCVLKIFPWPLAFVKAMGNNRTMQTSLIKNGCLNEVRSVQ
jgi:hypothetical protein